jgi:hypothetical protein
LNLITLENFVMVAIRKKEYTALQSLDISKAYDYDTCWRFGILRKLQQWKIDDRILKFISNFMSNRKLNVAGHLKSDVNNSIITVNKIKYKC